MESLGPMSLMFSASSAWPGMDQHVSCAQYDSGSESPSVYWLAVVKAVRGREDSEMR